MSHDHHHAAVACKTELAPERSDLGLYRPDRATGLVDWLTTVDHKKIGIMYGAFAMLYFLIGGVEALAIRTQLARPDNDFVTARMYNQLFTMHGTTMIFLGVMPLSAAFFNFLVPLQVGARDVAFPRLNAFSLWTFVFGAFVLNASWLFEFGHLAGWFDSFAWHKALVYTDFAPANGWFSYAPLSGTFGQNGQALRFTGVGTDFWIIGIQILGVASLAASFNFICTIINMRAKGMTMMRLPVFTWMTLVTSVLIILAFPAITVALIELMFDRAFGANFFNPSSGGQPVLWQHLFWIFGHPEVYILVLPAMGIVSEILPTFSGKALFGYPIIVFSGAVIGFLGFAVWSHHMFTTGLGPVPTAAFSLLTMAIAVDRREDLQLAPHHVGRKDLVHDRDEVRDRPGAAVHRRWSLGCHALDRTVRHPADGHLLHRRPLPLRAVRRNGLRSVRRLLLLVAEGVRQVVERKDR